MCEVLDKVENRGIEKGVREGRKQGEINGGIKMLVSLVRDETLSITKAAAKAKMTQEEFKRIMDKYPEEDA